MKFLTKDKFRETYNTSYIQSFSLQKYLYGTQFKTQDETENLVLDNVEKKNFLGMKINKKLRKDHVFLPSPKLSTNRRMGISKSLRKPFTRDMISFVKESRRPNNVFVSRPFGKFFRKMKRRRFKK